MTSEFHQRIEQRRKHIALLQELIATFQKGQHALLVGDIKEMQLYTTQEHGLCAELLEMARAEAGPLPPLRDDEAWDRWEKLGMEIQELESRARHLGRVQASLLKKGKRALEIYSCLLATLAPTYSPRRARREVSDVGTF